MDGSTLDARLLLIFVDFTLSLDFADSVLGFTGEVNGSTGLLPAVGVTKLTTWAAKLVVGV